MAFLAISAVVLGGFFISGWVAPVIGVSLVYFNLVCYSTDAGATCYSTLVYVYVWFDVN
jgi:hypothetical protein